MNPDFRDLRPEDMTPEQQEQLPDAAHDDAMDLAAQVAALPGLPIDPARLHARLAASKVPPPVEAPQAALPKAPPKPRRWWPAALAAAAAALVAVIGVTDDERERGMGATAPGSVHLQAAAEGPGGLRPLRDGDTVGPDERVIFQVQTDTAGWLTLAEDGAVFYPPQAWAVEVGTHTPGAPGTLSYRPDVQPDGAAVYRAQLCTAPPDEPDPASCAEGVLRLHWSL